MKNNIKMPSSHKWHIAQKQGMELCRCEALPFLCLSPNSHPILSVVFHVLCTLRVSLSRLYSYGNLSHFILNMCSRNLRLFVILPTVQPPGIMFLLYFIILLFTSAVFLSHLFSHDMLRALRLFLSVTRSPNIAYLLALHRN